MKKCGHRQCTPDWGCLCSLTLEKASCGYCSEHTEIDIEYAKNIVLHYGLLNMTDDTLRVVRDITDKLPENDKLPFNEWYNTNMR